MGNQLIKVKFLARMTPDIAACHIGRQLPSDSVWGDCLFSFDESCEDYDWLVVYHDIRKDLNGEGIERLSCPRSRTILLTCEPSSITVYGNNYLSQYGTVITSQEPWVVKHPGAVFTQTGQVWFYGLHMLESSSDFIDVNKCKTFEELLAMPPQPKSKLLSTVCSTRKGGITLHDKRVSFTEKLMGNLSDMDRFGHGVRKISDKAEALDDYKYHLIIENHFFEHCFTEKLPDTFLAYSLPIYYGCPNIFEYFPKESIITIDINNLPRSIEKIRSVIDNNEYNDRLPYIVEARRRTLMEFNIFAVISRQIDSLKSRTVMSDYSAMGEELLMSRQTFRKKNKLKGAKDLWERYQVYTRHIAEKLKSYN